MGISSVASAKAAMTGAGGDVVLHMGSGDIVVQRNLRIDDLHAGNLDLG